MKRPLVLGAAIMLVSLPVTAEEAPSTAGAAAASTRLNPGPGMSPRGTGGHHRHGMKQGKGKQAHGAGHSGKHQDFHRQVINRLDLMDARLSKMEAMLEKLLQR